MKYHALINRVRGPYEQILILTFKSYGPNTVRSMRLECQNKYFPYGPKSRLIRALLYTYTNKIVYDEILLSQSIVYCVSPLPGPCAGPYTYVRSASQPIRSKNLFRISISIMLLLTNCEVHAGKYSDRSFEVRTERSERTKS